MGFGSRVVYQMFSGLRMGGWAGMGKRRGQKPTKVSEGPGFFQAEKLQHLEGAQPIPRKGVAE